ncbi:MAG: transposase, partial [Deltaproteobacteria bacterium]|nr:transposase [Deltaproteobacteria bacterium]
MPSPDHSTFSRFRKRLSKKTIIKINSEVFNQFDKEDQSINEGIAIDARLVQFASRPISKDEIIKLREKKETPEGKLDK